MKFKYALCLLALTISLRLEAQTNSAPAEDATETLICIRHGEKPKGGLGQLTCRGLNRALALPAVLLKKYGTPQYIFAPSPMQKVDGKKSAQDYYYIRPLMTIEPTAIQCGLPVNTAFGFREVKELERELEAEKYQHATVFIAWEHGLLDQFAKNIVRDNHGDAKQVGPWPSGDYDTIFVIRLTRSGGETKISFAADHEGLDNLSDNCPGPAH
jgi:hypothetical protein